MLKFSLKKLTLEKITIDNSLKYFPKSNQTRHREPKMIKNNSTHRKQSKNISQSNKKSLKT